MLRFKLREELPHWTCPALSAVFHTLADALLSALQFSKIQESLICRCALYNQLGFALVRQYERAFAFAELFGEGRSFPSKKAKRLKVTRQIQHVLAP